MKKLFLLILSLMVLAGCNTLKTPTTTTPSASEKTTETTKTVITYTDITVAEAKQMIDAKPDLVIIDVSPHYDKGHIPGAINYYVGDGSLDNAIPSLDPAKEYLVYCHVDSASIAGAQKLINAGFEKVYRLKGNYKAWVDAGYPVEK